MMLVETHLARLMGAQRAFAVNSGMTALDVITRLLSKGDQVIAGNDLYGGTNRLLNFIKTHQEIQVHHVDTTDVKEVEKVLNERTRLVLIESPTNPLIKICDLMEISKVCHQKVPDVLVVVDNTMV
jgi:cystathionine beta-lyase